MTNREILRIAMEQSAIDINCKADDFLRTEHVIVFVTVYSLTNSKSADSVQ